MERLIVERECSYIPDILLHILTELFVSVL